MLLKARLNSIDSREEPGLFCQRRNLLYVSLACLLLSAIAIRIYYIETTSLVGERQFRSALIARLYYYDRSESISDWQKQVTRINVQQEDILEPPILEFVVSSIYWLIGREDLRVARLFSTMFWMIGSLVLFKITKRVVSLDAAVYATAYYLFVPIGIRTSISFLPDPLMIMMFLFSIFTIVWYYEKRSTSRLVIVTFVSGIAILIKPLCLFAIFGVFISLKIFNKVNRTAIIDLFIFSICLFPATYYYLYGIFSGTFLTNQAQVSFLPHLVLHWRYWAGWLITGVDAVGLTPLIAALLGASILPRGLPRALLIGLFIGYIVFCLVFTYHIHFASHYHLQLMIIVALAFGPLITLVINHIRQVSSERYWPVPVVAVLLLGMLVSINVVQGGMTDSYARLESKKVAQEIGRIVGHSSKSLFLASYYGWPLKYYGELSGVYWPRRIEHWALRRPGEGELSIEDRFNAVGFIPEYFIITDFKEFESNHADLKEFLARNSSLIAASDEYLIYDLKEIDSRELSIE